MIFSSRICYFLLSCHDLMNVVVLVLSCRILLLTCLAYSPPHTNLASFNLLSSSHSIVSITTIVTTDYDIETCDDEIQCKINKRRQCCITSGRHYPGRRVVGRPVMLHVDWKETTISSFCWLDGRTTQSDRC